LSAPPSGALFALPLLFNLVLRHPSVLPLVHREGADAEARWKQGGADPFDEDATELSKTRAAESCLWEIETLKKHYNPAVASFARAFEQADLSGSDGKVGPSGLAMEGGGMEAVQPYPLKDFMKISYKVLIAQETKKAGRRKQAPTMTYEKPETIFAPIAA
jgi:U3 small nucleolar RNA-associated protein 19